MRTLVIGGAGFIRGVVPHGCFSGDTKLRSLGNLSKGSQPNANPPLADEVWLV